MYKAAQGSQALGLSTLFTYYYIKHTNSVASVLERTTPTERPPVVGEISANV
jgi:hypothetical protein